MQGAQVVSIASIALATLAAFALGSWSARTGGVAAEASAADLEAQVTRALDEADAIRRVGLLTDILGRRTDASLRAVLTELEARLQARAPLQRSVVELVAEEWATHDVTKALAGIDGWPEEARGPGMTASFRAWARIDPLEAFVAAQTLPLVDQETALRGAFEGMAETGDRQAWNHLASLPSDALREELVNIVMKSIIWRRGLDALYDEVDAIETAHEPGSPRDFKLAALRTAVGLGGYHEPEKALAFARRFSGGPYDNNLLRRLAIHWVMTDPTRAMDAIVALPPDSQRDKALRDAYRIWLRRGREDAVAWVPDEIVRDPRYAVIAEQYALALARRKGDRKANMRDAIAWSERVEDPVLREKVQAMLGAEWMNREPEAAGPWVAEKGLVDAVAAVRRGTAVPR